MRSTDLARPSAARCSSTACGTGTTKSGDASWAWTSAIEDSPSWHDSDCAHVCVKVGTVERDGGSAGHPHLHASSQGCSSSHLNRLNAGLPIPRENAPAEAEAFGRASGQAGWNALSAGRLARKAWNTTIASSNGVEPAAMCMRPFVGITIPRSLRNANATAA